MEVADLRPSDGSAWRDIPELPEAAARVGTAFVSVPRPGQDGRLKVVLQSPPPAAVEAWLRGEGPAAGLVDIYGDPARGFAGTSPSAVAVCAGSG